ncbi:MAG: bifunctional demethylmenaquinone methyltransferase/2-methoxy-6-polyprenyl-1,4-benzoquinol methylase UbiE [Bacteroidaceae bacterium]|nr:bifunctional demethylmenaquinone methyltransferase/2-methoxy-6-polyprenyl-1,4-benzoquinol methylase UbiE [Bacteroidaceae bacterium]MBP9637093.1 bifunctional demethylmenaquinone methyltransferase/2-methoxy-6-polyprenyl-1,4-benzoquinol methylase UbiE [Bacteroidaceae bacterium]
MYEQEKIKPYRADGEKTEQVEQMFDSIAHSYDRLNHVLSLGIDRGWRQKAIRQLEPFHPQEMLDVATGTGDFALLAARMLRPKRLLGCDLSEGMMQVAREKVKQAKLEKVIDFAKEDCTALTFAENSFDAITVAFGIRNFADLDKGLTEMHRVLRPNGKLIILELTAPEYFPMKQLFKVYARVVIPTVGKLLSKDRSAYDYLPNTIQVFPQGEVMRGILQKAGFQKVDFERLTLGICTLYLATK